MTITIHRQGNERMLELGGGASPGSRPRCLGGHDYHLDDATHVDPQGHPTVDQVVDFSQPLPARDGEFDCVLSAGLLHRLPWQTVPALLAECFRVVRPGGKAVFVVRNAEAAALWVSHRGWEAKPDHHPAYIEANVALYGAQDGPNAVIRTYLSPSVMVELLHGAGFGPDVVTRPYGDPALDMVVETVKPLPEATQPPQTTQVTGGVPQPTAPVLLALPDSPAGPPQPAPGAENGPTPTPAPPTENGGAGATPTQFDVGGVQVPTDYDREVAALQELAAGGGSRVDLDPAPPARDPSKIYTFKYFDCGSPAYGPMGLWDRPQHVITTAHVLRRRPQNVMELGCGRGYLGKRLQDAGVRWDGIDVSKHCFLTRVAEGVWLADACQEWPQGLRERSPAADGKHWDLCLSVGFLEHVPEPQLPALLARIGRCRRHLHGVTLAGDGANADPARVTLKDKDWWRTLFSSHGVKDYEILSVAELEHGEFPEEVLHGDGKLKVALGTYTTMTHHGWENVDVHDLGQFAQANGYRYRVHDLRQTLPYGTGTVDLIHHSHMLEHLSYADGLRLLRECRRVIRPTGAMRVSVPDVGLLQRLYAGVPSPGGLPFGVTGLADYDEVFHNCAQAPTPLAKLWALLHQGHQAAYDGETLAHALTEAGWAPLPASFRVTGASGDPNAVNALAQIQKETLDLLPCLSLYFDAVPQLG